MEEIIEKYIQAARSQKDSESYQTANKWHSLLIETYKQLKEQKKLRLLRDLLTHEHIGVRSWAATHYLSIDEDVAKKTLRDIANVGGLLGLSAETVIKEWDNGNLKSYYMNL